jgi:histidinol-phosphate aminotransferase
MQTDTLITRSAEADRLRRGFTRRSLARAAALLGAGAALPFYNEPALAQLSNIGRLPPDAVKINANENPLGPCPEALEAIARAARNGGRYQYEETSDFVNLLASQEGLKPDHVMPFAGSSDPLHRVILAFTSKTQPLVMADPGYEAGQRAAAFVGSQVIRVPLRKDYAHDVRAMAAAHPTPGVFYICNPNNPSGTLTPREDIEWLVKNKPAGSIVLLDEAYIHFTEAPTGSDLVAAGKDVIILRTFSKLYGMAGLRAGAAFGRPDLLEKLRGFSAGALPVTGMVAAIASLKVKNLVPERRAYVRQIREDLFDWLEKNRFSYVPSVSNKFMVDVRRPGQEVVREMAARKVYIGRVWPAWPTHVRVSIGTREEMEKFKAAFLEVMS